MGEERYNNQPQDGAGGTVVGATSRMTTTVGTAPPPTTDCGATTTDDGLDCAGSWNHGKVKTTDVVFADGRSEDDDPREGDCCVTGAVDAPDWLKTTMREQTLELVSALPVITRHFSPKRRRILGPSRESRRESSDDSAEGEDNNQLLDFLRRRQV